MDANKVLIELFEMSKNHLEKAENWKNLPLEQLRKRPNDTCWNALECLEHLNYYGNFYLPEIRKRMELSNSSFNPVFNPGILGNYFAKMMLPKTKAGKMKTFKEMNPYQKTLDKSVLEKFIAQQKEILELLEISKTKNLNQIKTSISISKWIKLKLGDTFRIVIYHNFRHIEQAEKALFL